MKREYNLFEEGFLTTIQTDYYRKSYRDGEVVYEPYSSYYPTTDCNYVHCTVEIDDFRVESVNLVKGKSIAGDTMSNLSPSNMDIVIDDPKVFEAMTKTVDEVIFNKDRWDEFCALFIPGHVYEFRFNTIFSALHNRKYVYLDNKEFIQIGQINRVQSDDDDNDDPFTPKDFYENIEDIIHDIINGYKLNPKDKNFCITEYSVESYFTEYSKKVTHDSVQVLQPIFDPKFKDDIFPVIDHPTVGLKYSEAVAQNYGAYPSIRFDVYTIPNGEEDFVKSPFKKMIPVKAVNEVICTPKPIQQYVIGYACKSWFDAAFDFVSLVRIYDKTIKGENRWWLMVNINDDLCYIDLESKEFIRDDTNHYGFTPMTDEDYTSSINWNIEKINQ